MPEYIDKKAALNWIDIAIAGIPEYQEELSNLKSAIDNLRTYRVEVLITKNSTIERPGEANHIAEPGKKEAGNVS